MSYHDQHYYIVQELCRGSMFDILNALDEEETSGNADAGTGDNGAQAGGAAAASSFSRDDYNHRDAHTVVTWAAGIARGLAFMHAKQIVHRDLKPQNVLLDRTRAGVPKICDFGLSRMYDSIKGGRRTQVAGTAAYLAPEVIGINHAEVATPVDVYAFAVTFWWMLHRCDPYPGLGEPQILMGVFQRGLRPPISEDCPAEIADLIEDCWSAEPVERPTMREVLDRLFAILDTPEAHAGLQLPLDPPASQ